MMKTLLLVSALLLVIGGACMAANVTSYEYDIYQEWNLVACPLVPFDASPEAVFGEHPQGLFNNLSRWDPTYGGSGYTEDEAESFGNILLGDGYWLYAYSGPTTLHFTGLADGVASGPNAADRTDMWISLPGDQISQAGSWHLIGNPFAHDVPVNKGENYLGENILFTDGTTLLNWSEASSAPYYWVNPQMDGWNSVTGGTGVRWDGDGDLYLVAGAGYWIYTNVPNLAMIILAEPE